MSDVAYDAVLVVSFGGPEGRDDVLPFLHNVLRGRNVPPERMLEVARHYDLFGGVSPLNGQNRALVAALRVELDARGIGLPVFWGNRHWRPFLIDTLREMQARGVRRALAFVTSAFGSHSGCRQYLDDIAAARASLGPDAPRVDKLRLFYDHPGFVAANAARLRAALDELPAERRAAAAVAFTAHSLPLSMATTSAYEEQLRESCALVASAAGVTAWQLVFQSRSGPPAQPWLEPDLREHLRVLAASGVHDVVVAPIGFVSDHMEVVYDIDTEAQAVAHELGLRLVRAGTAGSHPAFVAMVRELIEERLDPRVPRRFLARRAAPNDACDDACCPAPVRAGVSSPRRMV